MREILFKAKRLDNGEWVEGYYFKSFDAYSEKEQHWIIENRCCFYGFYEGFSDPCEIDSNTLCQFTGLTDKDGDKIWENDIVDVSDCWWNPVTNVERDLVEWDESKSGFYPYVCHNDEYDMYYYPEASKVIGNKFDNPTLLEGDNQT